MISIVDAEEMRHVLRPTIYRPSGARVEWSLGSRQLVDESSDDRRGVFAAQSYPADRNAEPAIR